MMMKKVSILFVLLMTMCMGGWAHDEATDSMPVCAEDTQGDNMQMSVDTIAANDTAASDSLIANAGRRKANTKIIDGKEWTLVGTADEFLQAFMGTKDIKLTDNINLENVAVPASAFAIIDYKGHEINGAKDDENATVPYYALRNINKLLCVEIDNLNMNHVIISGASRMLTSETYNCNLDEIIFEKCMVKDEDHLMKALVSSTDNGSNFSNILFIGCSVYNDENQAGLLSAYKENGSVKNCVATVKNYVYAQDGQAGSFIGQAKNVDFENCMSFCSVSGYDDMLGGIVGEALEGCTFTDCNFYGLVKHVDNSEKVEGLIDGLISYCSTETAGELYTAGMDVLSIATMPWTLMSQWALTAVLRGSYETFAAGMNLIWDTGVLQKTTLYTTGTLLASKFVEYSSKILLCATVLEYAYFAYSIYSLGADLYNWTVLANSPDEVGGIVGHAESSTFSRCSNYGMVYSLDAYGGGIVGYGNDGCVIKNCLNQGAVHGGEQTGGIAGYMEDGSISTCLNLGNVGCEDDETAGYICGDKNTCKLSFNCYTAADSDIDNYTASSLESESENSGNASMGVNQKDIVSGWLAYVMNSHSKLKGEGSPWRQTIGTDHWPTLNETKDEVTESGVNFGLSTVLKVYSKDMLSSALVNSFSDIEIVQDIDYYNSYDFNLTSEFMPFRGSIEGNGHTLKNVNFQQTGKTYSFAGLESWWTSVENVGFLSVAKHATFRNFNLSNFKLLNSTNVKYEGLLVGGSDDCVYENIHIIGSSSIDDDGGNNEVKVVGGLVGNSNGDTFTNCSISSGCSLHTWGDSFYDAHLGGLVGDACGSVFKYCSNAAKVSADDNLVGGIVGMATSDTEVSHCYNSGYLKAYNYIGGLVGELSNSTIEYCVENGTVKGMYKEYMNIMGPSYVYPGAACLLAGKVDNGYNINHCLSFGLADDIDYDGVPLYSFDGMSVTGSASDNYYCNSSIDGESDDKSTFCNLNSLGMTTADITSGKLTYTLNLKGWELYQDIDNNVFPTNYPVTIPEAGEVSINYACDGTMGYSSTYSNRLSGTHTPEPDKFGICTICGSIQTPAATITIDNETDMVALARANNKGQSYLNTHFDLNSDLDMNGITYAPIGRKTNPFRGEFDGHAHRICNLNIETSTDCAGIFGRLGDGAVVKNLIMDASSTVTTSFEYGSAGIAGGVGSPLGEACNVKIINCGNEARITGVQNAAGILGGVYNNDNSYVTILNCYNMGEISGKEGAAALCGYLRKNFDVENCWNTGIVSGYERGLYFTRDAGNCSAIWSNNYSATGSQSNVIAFFVSTLDTGEFCWRINGSDNNSTDDAWFQLIGTDKHPVFVNTGENKVYKNKLCDNTNPWFDNHLATGEEMHDYNSDGICLRVSGEIHGEKPAYDDATSAWNITKPGNLYWIADKVDNNDSKSELYNCNLMNDIVVNKNVIVDGELNTDADVVANFLPWTPIGYDAAYTGTFNGNGHTVGGLYINEAERTNFTGMFGLLNAGANINNLGVVDSYFSTSQGAGTLAGAMMYDKTSPSISNCYTTGLVSGSKWIGGLVGVVIGDSEVSISNCYSLSNVKATGDDKSTVGALVGYGQSEARVSSGVKNCYYMAIKTNGEYECGTDKSSLDFRLGTVCQLLNNGQNTNFWAQNLETMQAPGLGTTDVTYERSMSYRWGTLILPFEVSSDGSVRYYAVKSLDSDNNLHLTAVDKVDANTPCFFRVAEGTDSFSVAAPANGCVTPEDEYGMVSVNGLEFYGLYKKDDIASHSVYYLAHDQLWQAEDNWDFYIYPYRACLLVTSASAKSISIISPDDETTAVGEITADGMKIFDGPVYNIAGQKLNATQKHQVNIVNGKKYFIK